jgi:hypothetical protein
MRPTPIDRQRAEERGKKMSNATMSPKIQEMLDQILCSFNLRQSGHLSRPHVKLAMEKDDERFDSSDDVKSAPSAAFVNSVRKRARAS